MNTLSDSNFKNIFFIEITAVVVSDARETILCIENRKIIQKQFNVSYFGPIFFYHFFRNKNSKFFISSNFPKNILNKKFYVGFYQFWSWTGHSPVHTNLGDEVIDLVWHSNPVFCVLKILKETVSFCVLILFIIRFHAFYPDTGQYGNKRKNWKNINFKSTIYCTLYS